MADATAQTEKKLGIVEALKSSRWNFLKRQAGSRPIAPLIREGSQPLQASADQIQASKTKTTVVAKP